MSRCEGAVRPAGLIVPVLVCVAGALLAGASAAAEEAEGPAAPAASPGCLAYAPAVVQLTGNLESEVYPTAPEYGEKPSSGKPDRVYVLELDKPVCAGTENDVVMVQMESHRLATLRLHSYAGRHVQVKGTLSGAKTPHHHTRVLMTVQSIRRS